MMLAFLIFFCVYSSPGICSLVLFDLEHFLLCIAKIWGAHVYIKIVMIQGQTLSPGNVLQSTNAHINLLNTITAANVVTVQ